MKSKIYSTKKRLLYHGIEKFLPPTFGIFQLWKKPF